MKPKLSWLVASLLLFLPLGASFGQEPSAPIRRVTFEFRLPDSHYPYAKWGTGDRVVENEVYFKGPLTNAKLVEFLRKHPQNGLGQQAQGYANQLEQDVPEHLLEVYLAKLDAGEDWTTKLTDRIWTTTSLRYITYWQGGNGSLSRHFYIWVSGTERAWVYMKITTEPTAEGGIPAKTTPTTDPTE